MENLPFYIGIVFNIAFWVVVYMLYKAYKAGKSTFDKINNDHLARVTAQQKRYHEALLLYQSDPSNPLRRKAVIDEGAALSELDIDFTSDRVINDLLNASYSR